jgi:AraC-like DNA-binding protein
VRWALEQFGTIPCRPVTDVVDEIGVAGKRFTEIFRDQVGTTPKLYSRIRRFQHALALVNRDPERDWTDVALACGYFDQAHFNHDFRTFCGISPSTYLHRTSRNHVALRD